jgi:hypothetical protein
MWSACVYSPREELIQDFQLPVPTKDEIVRVNGRPLTLNDFLFIRSQTEDSSAETAYWLGVSTLVIQNHGKKQGKNISAASALLIARYALGKITEQTASSSLNQYYARTTPVPTPQEVKKEIEQLTQQMIVLKNPTPLSQFY